MWKIAVIICLGLAISQSEAARRMKAADAAQEMLSKRSLDDEPFRVEQLLQLTKNEALREERSSKTAKGTLKVRYQETYKGVPVFDTVVTADQTNAHDISGALFQDIDEDLGSVEPRLSASQALKIAADKEGYKASEIQNSKADLMVFMDKDDTARFAYLTDFFYESPSKVSRPRYIIDAVSGDVLDEWEDIDTHKMPGVGGNLKTTKYEYGVDFDHLDATADATQTYCTMENTNVKVYHMNFGSTTPPSPHKVLCAKGAQDEANGGFSPANDALFFGGVVFDMYFDWYKLQPLTFKLTMRVHYNQNYENAFWNGKSMTFGDGKSRFYPLVSLDVTAHEVSHGFTGQNSGLVYKSQSGGMNEAFSDMAGEAAENYMKSSNDWKVGYDIFKSSNGALRYMDDPTKDGKSIGHYADYQEGINVHYSSGIYNKAFYTLATTTGWTTRKAFEIFVRANRMYWTPNSRFLQGACDVRSSANDLGYSTSDVENAFSVVGLTNICDPEPTPAPPTVTILQNNVELTGLGNQRSSKVYYSVVVPGNPTSVSVQSSGGTGDVDIYVKYGALPTKTDYDLRPYKVGNNELATYTSPKAGTYYIMLYGYSAYKDVTLKASYF